MDAHLVEFYKLTVFSAGTNESIGLEFKLDISFTYTLIKVVTATDTSPRGCWEGQGRLKPVHSSLHTLRVVGATLGCS